MNQNKTDGVIAFLMHSAMNITLVLIGGVSILCAFTARMQPPQGLVLEIVMRLFFVVIGGFCLSMAWPGPRRKLEGK